MTNHIAPKYMDLTDSYIDGQIDFRRAEPMDKDGNARLPIEFRDTVVKGLRLRIGKRSATWFFYHGWNDHGVAKYSYDDLGPYDRGGVAPGPVMGGGKGANLTRGGTYIGSEKTLKRSAEHLTVEAARDKGKEKVAHVITGSLPPSKNAGIKFGEAFDKYVAYLEAKAASKGKPPRWARNVKYLATSMILPQWKNWPLLEMSERPGVVEDWHLANVKKHGAVSANHAARIVRAVYRRIARRDRSLPAELPTSAVEFVAPKKRASGAGGMASADFPAWFAKLNERDADGNYVLSAVRRSYHLTNLLTGARPGELARTKWGDLDANTLMIGGGNLKTGNYVSVPLTPAIRKSIDMAKAATLAPVDRDGNKRLNEDALIWPGCSQASRDDLPATGMDLRRTYKTVATICKVDPQVSEYLMGHAPDGIGPRYILRWVIEKEQAFKDSQAKISEAIIALLDAKRVQRAA